MTQKRSCVIADVEEARAGMEEDYPMVEATPIVNLDAAAATSALASAQPPSFNPNYHATAYAATDATMPTVHTMQPQAIQQGQPTIPPYIGRNPMLVVCPYCHEQTRTRTRHHANMITWIIVVVLGFFCWFFCLCCIPFCCRGCQETDHYCTRCHRRVSKVGPFSSTSS